MQKQEILELLIKETQKERNSLIINKQVKESGLLYEKRARMRGVLQKSVEEYSLRIKETERLINELVSKHVL